MIDGQLTVEQLLQAGRVPEVPGDASRSPAPAPRDASHAAVDAGRLCAWCTGLIPAKARRDAVYCGVVCRKRAHRFKQAVPPSSGGRVARDRAGTRPAGPMRFAYADPPYPGKAGYYVERQEVDHQALIAGLEREFPDGWALSTSAAALRDVLPMCPASTRVCVWRRRVRPTRSRRALGAWEPLLVVGGRELDTGAPQDLVDVLDYRGRYDSFPDALVGMKPPEFAVWMFRQLGAAPGDELHDLFPGSGAIARAWALYASPGDPRDASLPAARDASLVDRDVARDVSRG